MAAFERIDDWRQRFIEDQKLFFDGTVAPGGRVNIAPEGITIQHHSALGSLENRRHEDVASNR